ncbi:MAG: hypothetical protein GX102_15215 [Porphyromonadaceae bacterium]|jgi:ABC-type transport system substrate-binding protein|nr:hypothetical protein [Porphyromonadaceae bacterium]
MKGLPDMNKFRLFLRPVIFVCLVVTACSSVGLPAPTAPNTPEPTLTLSYPTSNFSPLSTIDPYNSSSAWDVLYETPINSVQGLNSEEILIFLISKWLEEKKQASIPGEKLKEFIVDSELHLLEWEADSGFILVATAKFHIVPEKKINNNWASMLLQIPEEGDIWWHLAETFGLEKNEENYILRNTNGWGT